MIDFGTLYVALIGYGLVGTLGSILLAPFWSGRRSNAYWIPIALAAVSAASKLFGNKSKADAAKSDREIANANEQARAKAVQNMLDTLKARGVDIYGPQTTTSSSTSSGTQSSQMRKYVDPKTRNLLSQIIAQQEAELNRGDLYGAGQIAQQARQANQASEAALAASRNAGASRGLSKEALMAMAMPANLARTRAVLDFQASLPEKNASYRQSIRGEGMGTVNSLMGSDTNSQFSNTGTSSSTSPQNLAMLYQLATGAIPQQISTKTGYNPWAEGLGAAADVGSAAYAEYGGKKKPTSSWA